MKQDDLTSSTTFNKRYPHQTRYYSSKGSWTIMTGFEPPMGLGKPDPKRPKSGWVFVLTCAASLALVLATSRLYTPHSLGLSSVHDFISRSLLWDTATRDSKVELSPDADAVEPDDGGFARTDDVKFDNYSLFLKGQRIFLHSGEFHTFRLPVPSLWPDILEKFKAAGLNSVSVYTHMGLINPAPGVVDFGGFRALQPLFDAAKAAGIWVVLRPGPYINAETTAGGIAHWITSEVPGQLRTNATDWRMAWDDYIRGIIRETSPNQINRGGPVIAVQIDNEFGTSIPVFQEYFEDLLDIYRRSGIVVPLTYNDPGQRRNFINGTGAVDLYGLDAYPQGFDCSNPTRWRPVTTNYHQYHQEVNPSQPWYFPEFQGGSFDAWGPPHQSVFNLQLWASNAKLINYYMLYGGTSWGGIPFHGVYTSYDYGSPITESRELTTKFDELKRQGLFVRSSPEFIKTDWIADASSGLSVSTNPAAFITLLRNPDTGAAFYIARQTDSTSTATTDFKLNVTTSELGAVQIPVVAPSITMGGRQSKVVLTDYAVGASSKITYSTAQVFYAGTIDGRDVLFLYGDSAKLLQHPRPTHTCR
ncbi:hypothetical protein NLJ89_g8601 [Agrocybe chaxingu]|uniref:Beta-galactosidase domain-containing protein n=1 Tax=Agrocybe chaxingu TaxID=84603 RepID=A0A9W8K257_9AGAR|nr:hypothetical protein NLJ89_g8601 [Agrocybe chaxingu]